MTIGSAMKQHTVAVTVRYLDELLPENVKEYQIQDGENFESTFEVAEGYGLSAATLRK